MGERTLSMDDLALIQAFSNATGVTPVDVLATDEALFYVVPQHLHRRLLEQGAQRIKRASQEFGKRIVAVPLLEEPAEFVKALFRNVKVESIEVSEGKQGPVARVRVAKEDLGRAVGRNGWYAEAARTLAQRNTALANVRIE